MAEKKAIDILKEEYPIIYEGYKEIGLWYRLSDKINRWKNMILTGRKAQNETLIDTFQDVTNYGIIAQLVFKGKWKNK